MTHIDLSIFRVMAVGVAIFGATSCLLGALLLLPPPILDRRQVVGHLLRALAFGFLHGLLFGLIWGLMYGLFVQLTESGLTVDLPKDATAFLVGMVLGGALGLSTGTWTKIWWTARRRQRPPVPALNWARLVGSIVVGCFLGLVNHAPTSVPERVQSVLMGGFVFSTIPFFPAVDWWTEELLSRHRVAYGLALIAFGAAAAALAVWLKTSIGGA